MESSLPAPLTPDQIAAVQAGGGFARFEDPTTHRVYFVVEQSEPSTLDDDYVRQKIAEAYDAGGYGPLDMAAVKAEFQRRRSADDECRR
jgi:hypothetical protein